MVGAVPWASTFHMGAWLAERYRSSSVFLAGDAAHVYPPAGEGRDRRCAWLPALVRKDGSMSAACGEATT